MPLIAAVIVFTGFLVWSVALRQAVLFLIGLGFGLVLAGMRFGFTAGWRNLIENRDPSGVLAQLVLMGAAAVLCFPLLGLYPHSLEAALGAPSFSLLIGSFVFGACMQLASGCGSGTLFNAGMGFTTNMAVLPMFAIGSFLGAANLRDWLSLGSLPTYGMVSHLGVSASLPLTLAGLALIGFGVVRWSGRGKPLWNRRLLIGALLLAVLAALNLIIAGQPWGIVYGLGLWAAKAATAAHLFNPAANAFWSEPTNAMTLSQSVFLDVTSITDIGILAGALIIAIGRPRSKYRHRTAKQWGIIVLAGFLLGYSSRLAFGCNIGAMVSGISTGSVHGWIWAPMAFMGSILGVRLKRHFGL